ncbi:MAG: sulfatase-like hydrolase/transferase [Synoicihabitans sp.]
MSKRPNIVVIMSDDHAAWATGCYGNEDVPTPHLDALSRSGLKATQAFTPGPVCSPARASFFTGQIPSRHGIHDWLLERPESPRDWLGEQPTLPALLQANGYRTGLVGKWHCGNSHLPQTGFDFWLSYARGQYPHVGTQHLVCNGKLETFEGPQSPYLTGRAIDFLNEADDRPFFLFLGLVDTHSPFRGHPEERVAPFRDQALPSLPQETYSGPGGIKFGNPNHAARRQEWAAQYYAAVTTIDDQVGRIRTTLEARGLSNETLVVYTSDHGHMNGHHGLYTKGNATVPQNFYDEAIRVPLLLSHRPTIAPATELNAPVDHCDLFATLADYAGIKSQIPESPGRSIRSLLQDAATPWRDRQYCEYGNARMVRTERWKLITRTAPHADAFGDELYDLSRDPRETINVIGDHANTAEINALRTDLAAYFSRWEDPQLSGNRILELPAQNPGEPWRLQLATDGPSEGTDWRVLDDYPA